MAITPLPICREIIIARGERIAFLHVRILELNEYVVVVDQGVEKIKEMEIRTFLEHFRTTT